MVVTFCLHSLSLALFLILGKKILMMHLMVISLRWLVCMCVKVDNSDVVDFVYMFHSVRLFVELIVGLAWLAN